MMSRRRWLAAMAAPLAAPAQTRLLKPHAHKFGGVAGQIAHRDPPNRPPAGPPLEEVAGLAC